MTIVNDQPETIVPIPPAVGVGVISRPKRTATASYTARQLAGRVYDAVAPIRAQGDVLVLLRSVLLHPEARAILDALNGLADDGVVTPEAWSAAVGVAALDLGFTPTAAMLGPDNTPVRPAARKPTPKKA